MFPNLDHMGHISFISGPISVNFQHGNQLHVVREGPRNCAWTGTVIKFQPSVSANGQGPVYVCMPYLGFVIAFIVKLEQMGYKGDQGVWLAIVPSTVCDPHTDR